jgi:penicillin G amidase
MSRDSMNGVKHITGTLTEPKHHSMYGNGRLAATGIVAMMLSAGLAAGCTAPDPTEGDLSDESLHRVPLTEEITGEGLHCRVNMIRDRFGIAHIYAKNSDDAAYAQGFVTAHDRLPQMDLLRRFGSGTLAEMFGALDASLIDTDLQMRVHRLRPVAEASYAIMQASNDPTDKAVVRALQRFADGVNAYATQLAAADHWDLDPNVHAVWEPKTFVPWTPIDSLVLGRFQAFSLSFTIENELTLTELYQRLRGFYEAPGQPADIAARRQISRDLMRLAPVGQVPTIEGFPNVARDTGTRSDAGRPRRAGEPDAVATAAAASDAAGAMMPQVPLSVFADARTNFPSTFHTGPLGTFGPQAFMAPRAGSNNWAMGPSKTGGKTLLGTDQHLQLSNPSIFYPIHIYIDDDTEVLGVSFPGIPGVILGTNGQVAWSGTVAYHDVNDIYQETITPCGSGNCVSFKGGQVPIETWNETIKIGIFGNIISEKTVTYERVPHHGPILPIIRNGAIVPRTGGSALSVRFTGYEPTFELRAVWDLMRARNIDQAFKSLRNFSFGGQNWTMIDNSGNIGWTSNVNIPVRAAAATTWNATTNPDGLAPFFVLPGDGSAEWEGRLSSRYVPHAINPSSGYLATANSDPVGATFDNDPLNQPLVNGRPLYAGVGYSPGLRLERISTLLQGAMARGPVTLADFATIQHDSSSTVGKKLSQTVTEALGYVANPSGAPADVAAYVATLTAEQRARLTQARTLLAGWSYKTPAAVTSTNDAEISDSAATTVFNNWMHFFIADTLDDELALTGFERSRLDDSRLVRLVYGLLEEPATMTQSASSQQPILCDRVGVGGPDDSCTKMEIVAMLAALDHLASADGYGSADPKSWRWGIKHRSMIPSVLPNPGLNLPNASDGAALAGGFPRAGDTFVINRADAGWNDLDFSQSSDGAAQRFLAEARRGDKIKVKWQLPGGTIFDSRSPHYRDLLDKSYRPEVHFNAPFEPFEVITNGEERWLFH